RVGSADRPSGLRAPFGFHSGGDVSQSALACSLSVTAARPCLAVCLGRGGWVVGPSGGGVFLQGRAWAGGAGIPRWAVECEGGVGEGSAMESDDRRWAPGRMAVVVFAGTGTWLLLRPWRRAGGSTRC